MPYDAVYYNLFITSERNLPDSIRGVVRDEERTVAGHQHAHGTSPSLDWNAIPADVGENPVRKSSIGPGLPLFIGKNTTL